MFLKRSIVLAAGILLFIAAFIIYFDFSHSEMEDRFKAEREKFGVEGQVLTAADSASAPASGTDTGSATSPAPPANPSTPASDTTNPTPPDTTAAPAMPDTNAAPATAPDTNAAPPPPPASTMNDPRAGRPSFFQLASYRPDDAAAEVAPALPGAVAETVAPTATNTAAAAPAPAATPASSTPTEPSARKGPATEGASVIVLLYHQFRPAGVPIPPKFIWTMHQDVFENEMKYIHDNGYNVISMDQLLKFIKHEGTVPPRAVCITIDDGYKSAVVYAAPILKQYGYPWTFFIYPDFVTVAEGSGAVSWNDLLELQKEGIDIECHSMTHPNLKLHKQKIKGVWHDLSPEEYAAWLKNETAGAKAILEQRMGKAITRFAYPYGEYNTQVEQAVVDAGFEAIFTVAGNPVHSTTSLHSIGRYTITRPDEKNFAAYLREGALVAANADPAPGATISNPRPVISATLSYAGSLDPNSIEAQVRDFGDVKHDFDPATDTVRLYLPRDLIAPVVLVNISARDASTGQLMVADWRFNYEPAGGAASTTTHAPISPPKPTLELKPAPAPLTTTVTPRAPEPTSAPPPTPTNTPASATPPEPLEAHPVAPKSSTD